jgi:hypothetical protein
VSACDHGRASPSIARIGRATESVAYLHKLGATVLKLAGRHRLSAACRLSLISVKYLCGQNQLSTRDSFDFDVAGSWSMCSRSVIAINMVRERQYRVNHTIRTSVI